MMVMHLSIRICEAGDIPALKHLTFSGKHSVEPDYFETAFQEQADQKRLVFLAFVEDELVGYTHLNFYPQYAAFARLKIPEIQDIFIHPDHRRKGLGAHLLSACEAEAKERGHTEIGIGVGVSGNFGAAQRLYHRMGYMPDGAGAVFDRHPVQSGDIRPIDDRLCLMLVKTINSL